MPKNDFGASHWSSDKVWERRRKGATRLRELNKIQAEILLEFLKSHKEDINTSPYKMALGKIIGQLEKSLKLEGEGSDKE